MVGIITSTRPSHLVAEYGKIPDHLHYAINDNNGYFKRTGSLSNPDFAENDKVEGLVKMLGDALVRLDEAIQPYRHGKGEGLVSENSEYKNAVEEVQMLLKLDIPKGKIRAYQARYEIFCGEVLKLNSKIFERGNSLAVKSKEPVKTKKHRKTKVEKNEG